MKSLYKYPQNEYPYQWLIEENQKRGVEQAEFELLDTGLYGCFNIPNVCDVLRFDNYCKGIPKIVQVYYSYQF